MTVSSQTNNETYHGNGSTTIWDLPFRFFSNSDIFAYRINIAAGTRTLLVLGTDYTLYGANLPEQFGSAPGKITTTTPLATGNDLYVERVMLVEQLVDIVNQGRFFPEVHENVFDRLTMLLQQSNESSKGAIRVAIGDPDPARLPPVAARANLLLSFDSLGNPIAVAPSGGSAADLALNLLNAIDPLKGAAMVGFKGRTVAQRLSDHPMLGDYANLAAALAAAGNKTVENPDGVTYKNVQNQQLSVFSETINSQWMGGRVHRAAGTGPHIGQAYAAESIEFRPIGSGSNGPSNADYAYSISNIKSNWFGTTNGGEIDGLNVTVRQGGRMGAGVQSDCAGGLFNVGIVHGSGWAACIEAQTTTFNTGTAAIQLQVQTAMGVLDSATNNYFGFTTTANAGNLNAAYFANQQGTGHWNNFLQFLGDGNTELFKVDDSGRVVLRAGTGPTPSKTLRAFGGSLSVMNDAQSATILSLSDTGSMVIPGSHDAQALALRGTTFGGGGGVLVLGNGTTNLANAGGAAALPATVAGFFIWNYNNTTIKVPFYAN